MRPIPTVSLIGLGVFVLVAALWIAGGFQSAELWIYDELVSWRAGEGTPDPRITLVYLTEADIHKYDYPLRDSKLAQLLVTIESENPRAIGIDLYRDLPEPRDGSELAQLNPVLARYPNIICIFLHGDQDTRAAIHPPAILANYPQRLGFNNFAADFRTVRRGIIFSPENDASLAWQLALLYLQPEGIAPASEGKSIRLGKSVIPRFLGHEGGYTLRTWAGYQFLFDFKGPQEFDSHNVDQVLTGAASGAFADKVVLIGGNSDSAGDFLTTPLPLGKASSGVPGVMIHAQAVNQFLRAALDGDPPVIGLALGWELVLLAVWTALATAAGYFCRSFGGFAAALAGCLGLMAGVTALLFFHQVWMASAAPGLAILLAAIGAKAYMAHVETASRTALMQLFSRHVSSGVAESLWAQRDQFLAGNRPRAQKLTATVLFTDLKNYSSISEALPPDDLMQWINECLGALARHVDRNGGIVEKYIGDSIMALFGFPTPRTTEEAIRQDAINAVRCAWEMKTEMKRLNDVWQARGLARVGLRIGIYTGELMAGTVGHEERHEYTVIGDSVNTASRLESVDKEGTVEADADCRILIGEPTCQLVKESFEVELVGSTQLKGQKRVSSFYRIVAPKDSA
jgi:adenylate cyclase